MRNFTPIFNTLNMPRGILPFSTAGSSIALKNATNGLKSFNKITLSGLLNGAQKTIGTVNQIVPLYNQIKPMFTNSKIILNVAKGLKNSSFKSKRNNFTKKDQPLNNNTIDIYPKTEEIKKESKKENEPSKPFFL